jgi:transposase
LVLLKAQGRDSKDVGKIVGLSHVSVNSWLNRYKTEGISGLHIKQGRGRKPILNKEEDAEVVLEAIKKHRQSVEQAKSDWECATDKKSSQMTFKRFLKSLGEDTNA